MNRLLAGLLMLVSVAAGAATWYVDPAAAGSNNGTSWANAWTNPQSAMRGAGQVTAGDTVIIRGTFPAVSDWSLKEGISSAWTHYVFTSSPATMYDHITMRNYTELDGSADTTYWTNITGTHLTSLITNNCNFHIDRQTNWYGVGSGGRSITVLSDPVRIAGVRITGATNKYASDPPFYTKSDSASEIFFDNGHATSASNDLAFLWIDQSSGHGAGAAITFAYGATTYARYHVHHCLFENAWSDILNSGGGVEFDHCIIRNRGGSGYQGCNDTFTMGGDTAYTRYHHNFIEPADNTLYYLWGVASNIHDFYFFNNVLTPVRPNFRQQYSQGSGVQEQGDPPSFPQYYFTSNVMFVANTWIGTTNDGPGDIISFVSKNVGPTGFRFYDGSMVIQNNLFYQMDTNASTPTPISLNLYTPQNSYGYGFEYSNACIVLDYNQFASRVADNIRVANWGSSSGAKTILTNQANVADLLGYTHNDSTSTVTLRDPDNWDFRPADTNVNMAQNLTSQTNLMPDINVDIYGVTRPASVPWAAGAAEYRLLADDVTNGLVLKLNFDPSDGWPTNHVITDRSGNGNDAKYYASAVHNTWPTLTNGPNGMSAGQFVVNYTNGFRYGTYAAITNVFGNLKSFTQGTWALWAWVDNNHVGVDTDDIFLGTSQDQGNWFLGKYYADGPMFAAPSTGGGQEPLRAHTRWPNVTTGTGWRHYCITWDGTFWTAYTNGQYYGDMLSWTNDGNYAYTTYTTNWSGTLVSTNQVGVGNSWISVGVNPHSGTPNPDDADGLPNNGQYWGRLADVRIYNVALTPTEVQALYEAQGVGGGTGGGETFSGSAVYVSSTGSDVNLGTAASPVLTANQAQVIAVANGVTNIIFQDGRYGTILITNSNMKVSAENRLGAGSTNAVANGISTDTGVTNVIFDGLFSTGAANEGFKANGTNIHFINCWAYSNLNNGILAQYSYTVISNCLTEGNGTNQDHHGIYFSGSNCTVVANTVRRENFSWGIQCYYQNLGSGNPFNCLIANNVVVSNYSGIVVYGNTGQTNFVINNTVSHSAAGSGLRSGWGIVVATNNIIDGMATRMDVNNGGTFQRDYNLSSSALEYTGAHDVVGNPGFTGIVGDYHTGPSSPGTDHGAGVSQFITTDRGGNTRPVGAATDIGAYEWTLPPAGGNLNVSGTLRAGQIRRP